MGEKAQEAIGELPIGKAAEILAKLVPPTKVRKPDRYVTVAAYKYEKAAADEKAAAADEKTAADEKAAAADETAAADAGADKEIIEEIVHNPPRQCRCDNNEDDDEDCRQHGSSVSGRAPCQSLPSNIRTRTIAKIAATMPDGL